MTEPGPGGTERLLPPAVRRPLLQAAAVSAALVVALGVVFHGERDRGGFDEWVVGRLPWAVPVRSPALSSFAALTGTRTAALASVLLALVFCLLRRWRFAVLAVAGPALTVGVTAAGKHLVDRQFYDDPGALAYPSGHTAGVAAVLLVVALAVLARARTHVVAVGIGALLVATVGAATVGFAMILLNGHYTTDVLAGYCTALAVTAGAAAVVDAVPVRARGQHGVASR